MKPAVPIQAGRQAGREGGSGKVVEQRLIDALALLRLSDGPLHPGERGLGARRQVLGRHRQRVLQRRDHPLDRRRVPQRARASRARRGGAGRRVWGRARVAAAAAAAAAVGT